MSNDVTVQNSGSIVLLHLNTKAAKDWVFNNVSDEALFFGGALAVEARYVGEILDGMTEDGLVVN